MKKYAIIKGIILFLYCAITLFLAITLWQTRQHEVGSLDRGLSLAVWIIVLWLIIGGSVYLACTLCSLVSVIVAKKRGAPRGTLVFFIVFCIAPVLTEGLFYLLAAILV